MSRAGERVPPWGLVTIAPEVLDRLARAALDEDVGSRDATTEATVDAALVAVGTLVAKQELVVAGLDLAMHVFQALSPKVAWEARAREGDRFKSGDLIASVAGPARAILTGERVALNFLQRMSGIATLTRRFVEAVEGTGAQIRDTRKTTPLLRALEKRAVEVGGGVPHRSGLHTGILVMTTTSASRDRSGRPPGARWRRRTASWSRSRWTRRARSRTRSPTARR